MGIVIGLVTGGVIWYLGQKASGQAEAAAGAQIKALGGLAVMDANRTYVASLNTMTVKEATKFNAIMAQVENLRRLQILDLSKSAVTSQQLAALANLREITTLQLNDTKTVDEDILYFTGMRKLESLYVARTEITDRGLVNVAKLSSLTILDISNNTLQDFTPLARLPKLTWLLVRHDEPFTKAQVDAISQLRSLRRLSANPNQLTEEQKQMLQQANSQLAID